MNDKYTGLTTDQYALIKQKYDDFLSRLTDVNKEPTMVYAPLPQKALDEIALIREISRNLQQKKDEDVKKTQQDKEEAKLKEAERLKEAEKAKEEQEDEIKEKAN